jgi:hypothetical protein
MYKGCEKLLISRMFELSVRNSAHEMELRLYVEFTRVGMLFSTAGQVEFIALYITYYVIGLDTFHAPCSKWNSWFCYLGQADCLSS